MDYVPPELTQEQRLNLRNVYDTAKSETPGLIQQSYTQDAIPAGKAIEQSQDNFNAQANYGDPGLSRAIREKSMKEFAPSYEKIEFGAKNMARENYFRRLSNATKLASDEVALNERIRMAKYQAAQRKKSARGALLGQVLGITGAVVGGVVGGPGGAMVGMGVGSGTGGLMSAGGE